MTDDEMCPICGTPFSNLKAVRDHTWDTHSACHHCGSEFDDREQLYTHWLEDHVGELITESRKRAEKKVGTRTVCPACGDRFGDEVAVRDHAWDVHGACHHCGEQFDEQTGLHAHWLSAHDGELQQSDRRRAEDTVEDFSFSERLTRQGPSEAISGISVSRRSLLGGGAAASVTLVGAGVATGFFSGGGQTLADHPAATALSQQPTLGPKPGSAEGTIVAFEDPSCPSCARFETSVFPQLKSKLIEKGKVSFVFRPLPVVQPWGESAVHALEAVQDRDESTFWNLKSFYFENQRRLGSNNVLEETQTYLSEETDLDATAVIQDARQQTFSGQVSTNRQTARQANVRGTPTFVLFDSGSFTTKFTGSQSYSVFANTLGV